MPIRPRCLLPLLFAFAGCTPTVHRSDAALLYSGAWIFEGDVASKPVSGEIHFRRGAYFFESNLSSCTGSMEPRLTSRVPARVQFSCAPLRLRFHVRDGQLDGYALASIAARDTIGTRQSCVAWTTDERGRRSCAQYVNEPVVRSVTREGSVRVFRTDG